MNLKSKNRGDHYKVWSPAGNQIGSVQESKVRFNIWQIGGRWIQSHRTSWRTWETRSLSWSLIQKWCWSLAFCRSQREKRQSFATSSDDGIVVDKIIEKRVHHANISTWDSCAEKAFLQKDRDKNQSDEQDQSVDSDTGNANRIFEAFISMGWGRRRCRRTWWGRRRGRGLIEAKPGWAISTVMNFLWTMSFRTGKITSNWIRFINIDNANSLEMNFLNANLVPTILVLSRCGSDPWHPESRTFYKSSLFWQQSS